MCRSFQGSSHLYCRYATVCTELHCIDFCSKANSAIQKAMSCSAVYACVHFYRSYLLNNDVFFFFLLYFIWLMNSVLYKISNNYMQICLMFEVTHTHTHTHTTYLPFPLPTHVNTLRLRTAVPLPFTQNAAHKAALSRVCHPWTQAYSYTATLTQCGIQKSSRQLQAETECLAGAQRTALPAGERDSRQIGISTSWGHGEVVVGGWWGVVAVLITEE